MNDFFAWAGTVCAASAVCTLVHILVGKTATGKLFRLLSGAVVVCVVMSPLMTLAKDFELPKVTTDMTEEALYDTALTQIQVKTEALLLEKVNEALASHGYAAEKLEIRMDISEDTVISITDIRVFVSVENPVERIWIEEIATKRLGQAVTAVYVNGG